MLFRSSQGECVSTFPGTDVYARDLDTSAPRARRCRFNTLTSTDGPITRIWSLSEVRALRRAPRMSPADRRAALGRPWRRRRHRALQGGRGSGTFRSGTPSSRLPLGSARAVQGRELRASVRGWPGGDGQQRGTMPGLSSHLAARLWFLSCVALRHSGTLGAGAAPVPDDERRSEHDRGRPGEAGVPPQVISVPG